MTKPILLALLLAAACKHSSSSSASAHTETSTVTESTSSESGAVTTTTTQTEGPGETTITVREYDPPEKETAAPEEAADAGAQRQPARLPGAAPDPSGASNVPRRGPLRKETVTVTRSGGETTQTRSEATTQAQGASEVKAAGKQDVQAKEAEASAPSAGCIGVGWLCGAAVLVGVVGIVYFAVKMRKAV